MTIKRDGVVNPHLSWNISPAALFETPLVASAGSIAGGSAGGGVGSNSCIGGAGNSGGVSTIESPWGFQIKKDRIRYAVIVEGDIVGYANTPEGGCEVVRAHFEHLMRRAIQQRKVAEFQIKYETNTSQQQLCKLYEISPGFIYNGRVKVCTVYVKPMPRVLVEKSV